MSSMPPEYQRAIDAKQLLRRVRADYCSHEAIDHDACPGRYLDAAIQNITWFTERLVKEAKDD